jgi:MarR family transcriptional regulator, organic hydroperoxide resistance regulator
MKKRENSKEDGRAVLVHLTSKGQKLVKQAVKMVEDADESFFSSLSGNQQQQFRQISMALISSNTC